MGLVGAMLGGIQLFKALKKVVVEEHVLRLPNFEKPFEVWTDALDYAISGVLMQEGCPIAFESWKLNDTRRMYSMHEKDMIAVVHCLRVWQHYLLGSKFVVFTDNMTKSCF